MTSYQIVSRNMIGTRSLPKHDHFNFPARGGFLGVGRSQTVQSLSLFNFCWGRCDRKWRFSNKETAFAGYHFFKINLLPCRATLRRGGGRVDARLWTRSRAPALGSKFMAQRHWYPANAVSLLMIFLEKFLTNWRAQTRPPPRHNASTTAPQRGSAG